MLTPISYGCQCFHSRGTRGSYSRRGDYTRRQLGTIKGTRLEETGKGYERWQYRMDVDEVRAIKQKTSLFSNPRFVALFEHLVSRSKQRALYSHCLSLRCGTEGSSAWGGRRRRSVVRLQPPLKTKRRSDGVSLDDMNDSDGSEDVNKCHVRSCHTSHAAKSLPTWAPSLFIQPQQSAAASGHITKTAVEISTYNL